ncbi:MAG: domain S-box/diguanylate cyclase protein [Herminiimonas sp.]|nr:domain S-box/diguanylate cyclase protein [Herminiimonas sp.]
MADSVAGEPPYRFPFPMVVASLLVALLLTGTTVLLTLSYRDTVRQEKTGLRNVSAALSAQVLTTTRTIEFVISALQRDYLRQSDNAVRPIKLETLESTDFAEGFLLGAYLYDAKGLLLASSGTRSQDLRAASYPTQVVPPISQSVWKMQVGISDVDPETGQGVLNFTRLLHDASGNTAGVILVQADSRFFHHVFSSLDLGEGGSAALFNRDGTSMIRGPIRPNMIGHSFSNTPLFRHHLLTSERGAFESDSQVDGVRRIYGYDSVEGYPMVVVTGVNKAYALSLWLQRVESTALYVGMLCVTILLLAWRIAREGKRKSDHILSLQAGEARLKRSSDYLKNILNAIQNPIWVLDSERRFVLINEAFCRLVGRSREHLAGELESTVLDVGKRTEPVGQSGTNSQGKEGEGELEIFDANGNKRTVIKLDSNLPSTEGVSSHSISVLTDISERKKVALQLAYVADYDPLTGLSNQSHFRRTLAQRVSWAESKEERLCVMLISLDRAQEVVELLGHEAGDAALKQVGNKLRTLLPDAYCLGRVQTHEFAVIASASSKSDSVADLATYLYEALAAPFVVFDEEFRLGPAIGIALFPQDGKTGEELFRAAETAKQSARTDVTDRIQYFAQSSNALLHERLKIERHLRRALDRREFRLVYQPKVEIVSGSIIGFEALLRWSNPVLGHVPPSLFIPIAEDTGLIISVGTWVLAEACRQGSQWTEHFGKSVKIAVNLSLRQFHQGDLLESIKRSATDCGPDFDGLELEITESVLMSRAQEVDAMMNEIRALGITLSIDDFGTGYSSLAHLKRFPVQRLKIDRSFIADLGKDDDSTAIVKSIIDLAHGLKLCVLAEGVETAEQLDMLKEMSCDEYQGYFFSPPLEGFEVQDLLSRNWLPL